MEKEETASLLQRRRCVEWNATGKRRPSVLGLREKCQKKGRHFSLIFGSTVQRHCSEGCLGPFAKSAVWKMREGCVLGFFFLFASCLFDGRVWDVFFLEPKSFFSLWAFAPEMRNVPLRFGLFPPEGATSGGVLRDKITWVLQVFLFKHVFFDA